MNLALEMFSEIADKYNSCEKEYNLLKIKNAAFIGKLIAQSALIREESRGGHIREDFQKENPDFKVHIVQQKNQHYQFEPVRE